MLYRSLWVQTPGSCINSRWQWEEWLSSCRVKAEKKAPSFVIHHLSAVFNTEQREWGKGFPPRLWGVSLPLSVLAGFYPVNHTDCWQSHLHHCFDGITGELAHAFFPPTGEIHFDDHEYWILGNMRFSWKKGKHLYHVCCSSWYISLKWCLMQAADTELNSRGFTRENDQLHLCCRGLANRPRPRGNSWNRPCPGTHALHGPESYNAPERNSDRAQANHSGWGVGFAPSLWYVIFGLDDMFAMHPKAFWMNET